MEDIPPTPTTWACWSLYERQLFLVERWRILQHTLLRVLLVTIFREHEETLWVVQIPCGTHPVVVRAA